MSNILIVSAAAAVVVVVVVALYLAKGSSKIASSVREDTLEAAWKRYVDHREEWPERDRRAIRLLDGLASERTEALRRQLQETVDEVLAAPDPKVALRQSIMDVTDRFVLAETLGGARDPASAEDADASEDFDSVVEAGVLRCFAMLRFGDYAKEDWYTHYLNVAEMNSRNVAAMVRKTVSGEQSSLESALHDPLTRTMQQVRKNLLDYPSRTAVERADKLTTGQAAPKLFPTQKQVDQLTSTMSVRFEKLFAGQIYRLERGPSVNPAAAFEVDASVLYTLLSLHFRHPTDAWRQIMGEALGPFAEAMQNEAKLLEMAQGYRQIWLENEKDGPLSAVLRKACRTAFKQTGASGAAADDKALVSCMMEDAGPLVGAIRDVLEES